MRRGSEIKVNPEILKGFCETSVFSIDEVANKLKTTTAKIKEIEEGLASFTLTQKNWLIFITVPSLHFL